MVLLTDDAKWNEALIVWLERLGVPLRVTEGPGGITADGILVNRVSARRASEDPAFAREIEAFLREQRNQGRVVVNGAGCLRLGCDKWAQAKLFERCGARTPETRVVVSGRRALPERPVLVKPLVGSFGRGIVTLGPGEELPEAVTSEGGRYVEQERLDAVDGAVHRVEVLGDDVLYEAKTQMASGNFNYCLASGDLDTVVEAKLDPQLREIALRIAREADMQIGSVEYLLGEGGEPLFIDLNPVSSFHPSAAKELGFDPVERLARWLRARELGEDGIWEKTRFYEGSARVPLIIRWPEGFEGGRVVKENVNLCDLFATLCDLAGLEIPENLDSRTLAPLLRGEEVAWPNESVSQTGSSWVMIKQDNLKYQYYGDDGPEVLFDLEKDPGESANRAEEPGYAGAMERFRKRLGELGHGKAADPDYRNAGYATRS